MKKFVTLSAVALAGATIGVGSTFGWWVEDTPVPKENVQAADSPAPVPTPTESTPALAPLEVPIAPLLKRIEISGPNGARGNGLTPSFGEFPVMSQFAPAYAQGAPTTGISGDDTDRLTKELINEAEELEKQGKRDEAQVYRKLIGRLQRMPRSTTSPPHVTIVPGHPMLAPHYSSAVPEPPRVRTLNQLDPLAKSLLQIWKDLEREARHLEENGQTDLANEKRNQARRIKELQKDFSREQFQRQAAETIHPFARRLSSMSIELEQEAQELEKKGDKEAAQMKRETAQRIRETLPKVQFGTAKGWVKIEPVAESPSDLSAIVQLDKELASLKEAAAKADDPEVRKQLMAKAFELGVKRHMLQSNIPKPEIREREALVEKERLESAIRSLKEDIRNIQPNVEQPESKLQGKPRDSGETLSGDKKRQKALAMALHNYAQQLRAQGHRDQAQALLDQANELEHHLLPRVTRSELVPKEREWNNDERKDSQPVSPRASEKQKTQFVDITLEIPVQEFDYEKLLRKLEHKFPQSKLRLLQESPHSDKMLITGRVADRDDVVSIRQLIHNEVVNQRLEADPHALGGSSSDEVHKILKSLHHEITELRSEVRNLRSVIKKESQDGKRDPEVQKQPGDKNGEQKGKQPGDQDERPETDDSKKPADSSEDKPQIDD